MKQENDVLNGIAEILKKGCIRYLNQKIENKSNKRLDFREIVSTNTNNSLNMTGNRNGNN